MPFTAIVSGKCFDPTGRPAAGLSVQTWMLAPPSPQLQLLATSNPTGADGGFHMTFPVPGDPAGAAPALLAQLLQGQRPVPCQPVALALSGTGAERSAWANIILLESYGGSSSDLPVAEIGQSLASVAGSIQEELARYPVAGGVYVLDEFELSVPVRLRVDAVGQIRAAVLPERSEAGGGELRFKLRPVLDVPASSLVGQPVPIEALCILGKRQRARLREMRVFDVASLWRLLANPTSQAALKPLCLPVDEIRARVGLLLHAGLPDEVARLLLKKGIRSVPDFLSRSPDAILQLLRDPPSAEVSLQDIADWQRRLRTPAPASPLRSARQ